MKDTTIPVDVAKSVFEIAVSFHPGHVAETHRLPRPPPFFAAREPTTVVMEACGMAHHWGRERQNQGHRVVLLPPHAVRPYVPRNKTDRTDAKGILEAFRNQAIHPVPVKTVAQQALAALHRLRSRWMAIRTSRINTVRGVLCEFGLPIPVGSRQVVPAVRVALEDADSCLPDAIRPALAAACDEIRDLETRIASVEHQLAAIARDTPVVPALRSVPGIGLLAATALIAVVGDIARFPSERHLASFLGLTPRESSTGLRRLGAISKRDDCYLRMLLIHGARAVLCHAKKTGTHDRLRTWALVDRLHLILAPMIQIPVRSQSVDLVIAHGIWNLARSAAEFRQALREAARVARPDAGLFVFTFSRNTLPAETTPVEGEPFVFTQFSGQPQCFLTESQLIDELGAAGFARDPDVPLTEYNRPRPGTLPVGMIPVLCEAAFRFRPGRAEGATS